MKINITIILCVLWMLPLKSQVTFERSYQVEGTNWKEYGMSVMQDEEGRYVVAVYCSHTSYDLQYGEIFRTDEYGEFIDSDVFFVSPMGYNTENEVLPNSKGGYVLGTTSNTYSGSVYSLEYKDYDYLNERSSTTSVRDNDFGQELILTSQNTYLLLGYSFDDGEDTVLYLGEYADSLHWIRHNSLNSAYNVMPRSAGQLSDGSYIITGYTEYPPPRHLYVAQISAELEFIWEKTFDVGSLAINEELPVCVHDDNISIPYTVINVPMDQSIQLLNINASGDSLGIYNVADGLDLDCLDVVIEDNGDIVMTGLEELDGPPRKVILIRTSPQGNVIWKRDYYIDQCAAGMSLAKAQDGGYVIAGFSRWPSPIIERAFLIKTDGEGMSTWVRSIERDSKLSIMPNPATTSFRIELPEGIPDGDLIIYSSGGKEELHMTKYPSGTYINVKHFEPGLYIVKLVAGDHVFTEKLVIQ